MASTELPTRDIASDILHSLSLDEPVLTAERFPQIPFEPMKAALDRLSSRCMVEYEPIDRELAGLEAEAESIVAHGSHEARVFEAVSKGAEGGITVTELEKAIGDKGTAKVGLGQAFKEKWVKKQGDKIVALVGLSCLLVGKKRLTGRSLQGPFHPGHHPRPATDDSGEALARTARGAGGTQEAQARQTVQDHLVPHKKGAQVWAGDGQGGDRPHGRDAGVWRVERREDGLQAVQL